jgi:hypothetical protein
MGPLISIELSTLANAGLLVLVYQPIVYLAPPPIAIGHSNKADILPRDTIDWNNLVAADARDYIRGF